MTSSTSRSLAVVCSPLIVALVAGMALSIVPGSAAAMRCNGRLIDKGDPMYRVRDLCGKPDYVVPLYDLGRLDDSGPQRWYYNDGPNQLLRELSFRDGRVRRIGTAGRGFTPPAHPGSCTPVDVSVGMTGFELLSRCGKPAQTRRHQVLHPVYRNGVLVGRQQAWIEDWFYTFGSNHLDRRIRLVNGRVQSIDTVD